MRLALAVLVSATVLLDADTTAAAPAPAGPRATPTKRPAKTTTQAMRRVRPRRRSGRGPEVVRRMTRTTQGTAEEESLELFTWFYGLVAGSEVELTPARLVDQNVAWVAFGDVYPVEIQGFSPMIVSTSRQLILYPTTSLTAPELHVKCKGRFPGEMWVAVSTTVPGATDEVYDWITFNDKKDGSARTTIQFIIDLADLGDAQVMSIGLQGKATTTGNWPDSEPVYHSCTIKQLTE